MRSVDADVIVVGAGVAGLAAALRLKDSGRTPLVLEAGAMVGGRMTSRRIGPFTIDCGVALPTRSFTRMRALGARFGLAARAKNIPFTLGIQDADGTVRAYRARHFEDILLDRRLPLAARAAFMRIGLDLIRFDHRLQLGDVNGAALLDSEDTASYVRRLGGGGDELLADVLGPGLRAAIGTELGSCSRAVLFSVARNTMRPGFWIMDGGLDQFPNALAQFVEVRRSTPVLEVRTSGRSVEIDIIERETKRTLRANGAIVAVPGPEAARLCPAAPRWLCSVLERTTYSRIACVFVGWTTRIAPACTGYVWKGTDAAKPASLEFEHLRSPGCCPHNRSLISVYFIDSPDFRCFTMSDDEIGARAIKSIREIVHADGDVLFIYVTRWRYGL
ncbi:MAG: FAD-dependent oxidoreductase, partial [Candidatus Eremiobacteraeota bacterium]|nr:FAD-dependent oxidoreductase [Candidatus Eremiobacteraeota bacterium]